MLINPVRFWCGGTAAAAAAATNCVYFYFSFAERLHLSLTHTQHGRGLLGHGNSANLLYYFRNLFNWDLKMKEIPLLILEKYYFQKLNT